MAKQKFDAGKYDFVGKGKYILPIWLLLMVLGMFYIGVHGMNYGIDFAGGTEMQVRFQDAPDIDKLRAAIAGAGFEDASVQSFGGATEFLIRLNVPPGKTEKETTDIQKATSIKIEDAIKKAFEGNPYEIRRVDNVGPQVGEELKRNSILAAVYSLLIILIYIGIRFDYKYAPGAVFCLLHDAIIMVAIYSVFDREVNVQTLAAILTLMGFALNATIILYDRIRENEGFHPDEDFEKVVNKSHNDMLGRTIITAVTMEFSVIALYFLSDGVIQQIAYTLGIGILLGVFSSTYIAGTIVIELHKLQKRRHAMRLKSATAGK